MKKFVHAFSLLLLAVFLNPGSAQAGIFTSLDALAQSEIYAQDPIFQSVGLLTGADPDGNRSVIGSGVLIDPSWILTAGHVVQREDGIAWDDIRFSNSNDVLNNLGTVYESDFSTWAPGYLQSQTPGTCLLYTSPSPRDRQKSRMPSSA